MIKFSEAKDIFNELYNDVNGYLISTQARRKLSKADRTLTYGEVTFDTFKKILNKVKPSKGKVFYDLGSGTGKAVILASLFENFSKLVGIEILEDLSKAAARVAKEYRKVVRKLDPDKLQQELIFLNADFLNCDISQADTVFIHSTCLHDQMMAELAKKLSNLAKGSDIITVTKTLSSRKLKLVESAIYKFGWGEGTVYFYRRI